MYGTYLFTPACYLSDINNDKEYKAILCCLSAFSKNLLAIEQPNPSTIR
jgi:hypothetical protein